MEAELFHADGRTDMTKIIVAFSNFADAPGNDQFLLQGVFMCSYGLDDRRTVGMPGYVTTPSVLFNLLATDFLFQILAHPVFKM